MFGAILVATRYLTIIVGTIGLVVGFTIGRVTA